MKAQHSVVLICPQGKAAELRDLLEPALGYTFGSGVKLSATGNLPVTHRGAHFWTDGPLKEKLKGERDILSEWITENGYTPAQVKNWIRNNVTISQDPVVDEGTENERTLTKREHFNHVIAGLGLQVIVEEL